MLDMLLNDVKQGLARNFEKEKSLLKIVTSKGKIAKSRRQIDIFGLL